MYDVAIVGSGPAALGVLHGLKDRGMTVCVITHSAGNGYIQDDTGLYAYNYSFSGGLDHWHGVSTGELYKKFNVEKRPFIEVFKHFYKETESVAKDVYDGLAYIPNSAINSNNLRAAILDCNANIVLANVEKITIDESKVSVKFPGGFIDAKKIVLCAGAIGTSNIIEQSDLGQKRTSLGNHINGYLVRGVEGLNRRLDPIKMGLHGHLKRVDRQLVAGRHACFFKRPAVFGMSKFDTLKKHKSIYAQSKKGIVKKIFRAMSIGLVVEAVYNRFGIVLMPYKSINEYFQIETIGVYKLHESKITLDRKELKCQVEMLNQSLKEMGRSCEISEDTIVSGIHFYNTVQDLNPMVSDLFERFDPNKMIFIGDSSALDSIGGDHHTFSILANNYNKARYL